VFRSGDASACTAAETLARTAVSRSLKVFSQTGSMFEKVSERKEANECRLSGKTFFVMAEDDRDEERYEANKCRRLMSPLLPTE
jgi:hypothetical protein